ncbi:hypothetical protein J5X84_29935 [Streptosporangiaceae bacterium NEAU-GS5]|nr:hypothetical protein [Streptosporangiaceae bacterium NEAU-GS5]
MTFTSDDEYGGLLRRALRAEADSIVPSPEGLDIIRGRIERRGIRGLLWWRIGAAAAGAVLVAGTVVMVVPELRKSVIDQVTTVPADNGTSIGDASGTSRPAPPIKITTAGPSQTPTGDAPRVVPTAGGTQRPSPKSSPVDPTKDPCATPTVVEPQDDGDDSCPPTATPSGRPSSPPAQTPSVSPSPSPSGCGDSCASPTVTPSPSDSAGTDLAPESPAS